ncbi:MAG: tRNA uridine-5-carboxymethylaminomethyl(34) synthesis enzyme MnmG [Ruminococcaceae bacterium]|nr:tRNA uridine-5-carboxymethylaminomethyl(34) synthesis enzyme MnmG [Oscillospiraceae bacterium]
MIGDYRKTKVAVVGAGHAGIEAALACARMGIDTVLFTLSLDCLANMPCNPSIGGTGKGHLVYEIDALGGEMGVAADAVTLQSRTLNLGKGPAVHSKRIQADRMKYHAYMKNVIENTKNLRLVQSEITDIKCEIGEDGKKRVCGVVTRLGAVWSAEAVIISTGTYLGGRVIVGEAAYPSGPDGSLAATELTRSLIREGVSIMRFKTGTPPRVHMDSIDYSKLELQPGEDEVFPYSWRTDAKELRAREQMPCYIAYTNAKTHEIIRNNLDKSPLYNGVIHGTGPRYCPSIEDKVVRFSDKERHQLFVEPMGDDTKEMYIQGFSSSLPEDVQLEMLHSIEGFENALVMRVAYAIEYDCADPLQLYPSLEFKEISGLYGAGQFNGSSGYEEAAAQGLIAGINAALKIKGEAPFTLSRDSSYIGTLIDDLVTKGTNEPYRIMTSRSEYRLLLRQDNADLRLKEKGYALGLISHENYLAFKKKYELVEEEKKRAEKLVVAPGREINELLEKCGTAPLSTGAKLADLIRRPQLSYKLLAEADKDRPSLPEEIFRIAEIEIKYAGYIDHQLADVRKAEKLNSKILPSDIDYGEIKGLRLEARQKLQKIRPLNIGQASRISGVSPADISVLIIYLAQHGG